MRVRGSEISADYVRRLRDKGRSWSVIARMTGASEIDLRRFHGGQMLDASSPMPASAPVVLQPAKKPEPATRVVRKPKAKPVGKKVSRVTAPKRSKAADERLRTVLIAAGMGADEAGVVVQLYRAGGKRQLASDLMPKGIQSSAQIKKRMTDVKNSAGRLGIKLSGGRGGYCLRPDSMHFVGRLEAVNCGGAR